LTSHRQAAPAESACEPRGASDDLVRGVRARQPNNAFLQIDHDQGRGVVEFGERHSCFLDQRGRGVAFSGGW
jgi:hypothetical protein